MNRTSKGDNVMEKSRTEDSLPTVGPKRHRQLAVAIAITASFTAGVGSGLVLDHDAAVQPTSTTTAAAPSPDLDASQRQRSRDRVVETLRNSRTRTGNTLTAACRDPRAAMTDDRDWGQQQNAPAAELAFYDVELFNTALHKYDTAADQFPAMSYRQIGLYTKAGARLAYFTDGQGHVQRDPVLDPPYAVFELDWCRSLTDFNAG